MTAQVWKTIALSAALLVWSAAGQAQMTSGSTNGQGAVAQIRPAPVAGRVGADPAAVALRPAGLQPVTSTAKQVPPPANPNEPLLTPESEQEKAAASRPVQRVEPVTTQPSPHMDHTRGVKKSSQTAPRQHVQKTKGKPHHAVQKASSVEPMGGHKGGKRGDKLGAHARHVGQHATAKSSPSSKMMGKDKATVRPVAHHKSRAVAGQHTGKQAHARKLTHVKPVASAPVAKKPIHHKHPNA